MDHTPWTPDKNTPRCCLIVVLRLVPLSFLFYKFSLFELLLVFTIKNGPKDDPLKNNNNIIQHLIGTDRSVLLSCRGSKQKAA